MHWQRLSAPREWFFYTHRRTIWRVLPGEWQDDALIAFTIQNQSQDLNRFRTSPFWRDRFGDASTSPHRFRWASFYQAIADALRAHRHDRQPLIRFLQEAQSRVEGLNLLSGDQFSDGCKGFIAAIDPFTLFALFNRGIRDSNRQAIARELAGFLGVQEPVPQSFEPPSARAFASPSAQVISSGERKDDPAQANLLRTTHSGARAYHATKQDAMMIHSP